MTIVVIDTIRSQVPRGLLETLFDLLIGACAAFSPDGTNGSSDGRRRHGGSVLVRIAKVVGFHGHCRSQVILQQLLSCPIVNRNDGNRYLSVDGKRSAKRQARSHLVDNDPNTSPSLASSCLAFVALSAASVTR